MKNITAILGIMITFGVGFATGWHCSYIHEINKDNEIVTESNNLEEI